MLIQIIYFLLIFTISYLGVWFYTYWSRKQNILDIPNERSSHVKPTPRGGGIIIFLVTILSYLIFTTVNQKQIIWSYIIGSIIICAISLWDDLSSISSIGRFFCHGFVAILVIFELGGFTELVLPVLGVIKLGVFGKIISFFWIVWVINAYNFMDGIDGIAGLQAITAGLGWFLLGSVIEFQQIMVMGGIIFSSSLGFLLHNWSPAKIFMGDVGSAFLGFTFAVLPFLVNEDNKLQPYLLWIGILLVWFFIFDSVFTLIRRIIDKDKIWEAHRRHIYQRLVIKGVKHSTVATIYGVLATFLILVSYFAIRHLNSYNSLIILTVLIESAILVMVWRFYEYRT